MKSIKILLLVITVTLLGSINNLMAQDNTKKERTPEEIAQQQTKKLTKELSLTEEQQKTVYDINLKYAQNKNELRQSMRDAKQQQDKRDQELKAALVDQQIAKFDSLRASQREKMKQARMDRKAAVL